MLYHDRSHAGRSLAAQLSAYANRGDVLVFGMPPGGVVVAAEVAEALRAPMDMVITGALEHVRVAGRIAILVDDGAVTGASMLTAVAALRRLQAGRIVVAVPVAPPAACARLRRAADELVCPLRPKPFHSVGTFYEWFDLVQETELKGLLSATREG